MRVRLILVTLLPLLLGGWFDEPAAWSRPDGRPLDPARFERDRSLCRGEASVRARREEPWIVALTDCMLHFGYIPLRRNILP